MHCLAQIFVVQTPFFTLTLLPTWCQARSDLCFACAVQRNNYTRKWLTQFVESMAQDLSQWSMDDLEFDLNMPRGFTTRKQICKEVWTGSSFKLVHQQRCLSTGIQNFTFAANDLGPNGTRIMLSRKGRTELVDDHEVLDEVPPADHVSEIRRALQAKDPALGNRSWVGTFKALVKNPAALIKELKLELNEILDWQQVPSPPPMRTPCAAATMCAV